MCIEVNSQSSFFIKTGKNLTNYTYTNALGGKASNLSSEFGNSYSIGFSKQFKNHLNNFPLMFDSEISFDENNASVFNKTLLTHWTTLYVGVNNSFLFQVLNSKKLKLGIRAGIDISTIVYGRQELGGEVFDLKKTNSFKGIFIGGFSGLQLKYFASEFGGFSFGYDHISSFNPNLNGSEKFSMSTNRMYLGVIFNLKKQHSIIK